MKEFIEKLIGRLEEKYLQAEKDMGLSDTYDEASRCGGRMAAYETAQKIVNQLAEEYKDKDCSECSRRKWYQIGYADAEKKLAEEYINCSTDTSTNTSSGWIPTSERLPEKNAIVLTCDKDGWISVKVNMPYAGVKNDFESGYYTAWMPLPPAYVPKEGRE